MMINETLDLMDRFGKIPTIGVLIQAYLRFMKEVTDFFCSVFTQRQSFEIVIPFHVEALRMPDHFMPYVFW